LSSHDLYDDATASDICRQKFQPSSLIIIEASLAGDELVCEGARRIANLAHFILSLKQQSEKIGVAFWVRDLASPTSNGAKPTHVTDQTDRYRGGGTRARGSIGIASSPVAAQAQEKPTEIRIGTQKGGFFPAVRQRHTVEDAFKPLGIAIKWIDFQFGPPLLEAINAGAVDFGFVGDSPPIFAQAGGARIRYVAAVKSDGNTQAIIVPKDSPIKTLVDLKGKRIAFGKGSSAHNLLVAALEKAGVAWTTSRPLRLRLPMRPRHSRKERSTHGRSGIPISRWLSSRIMPA
jgi:hypothetical protein